MNIPLAVLAALSLSASPAKPPARPAPAKSGAPAERSKTPDRYKWKLGDLYPSDQAWSEAKAALAKKLPDFARHRGHLSSSARALGDALTDMGRLQNDLERLNVYASARSDEDTREPKPRAMKSEAERLAVEADAAISWVRPEILALPAEQVRRYLGEEPRLRDWAFYLDDVLRWKPHTLAADEERIVARTGDLAGAGADLHGVLTNADLPYPTVKLSTGESIRLDPAGYGRARTTGARADRVKVFEAFFGALKRTSGPSARRSTPRCGPTSSRRRCAASAPRSSPRSSATTCRWRSTSSSSKDVNANLPTLHRYLRLRQRMLGLPDLRYEDLYAPIVKSVDRRYAIDQAMAMTLDAVSPLGDGYVTKLRQGFEAGWTDFLPSTGKRSGAYSTGVYGVHPYQLLNFNGQWEDVSTLAHEAGHSMHTLLSYEKQPYPTSEYAIFVAEVASTLNENLLFRKVLGGTRDDAERLALLGQRLESLRTTLFRQTMFAEFELAVHERAEKGEALTGEKMSAALPRAGAQVLRARSGHLPGRDALRRRVDLRPALLLRLLRLPVRHQPGRLDLPRQGDPGGGGPGAHRRARPLPGHARRRRIALPGGPAARGRGGHDHLGAVRRRHGGDERDHGRDGGDPRAPADQGQDGAVAAGPGAATASRRRPGQVTPGPGACRG